MHDVIAARALRAATVAARGDAVRMDAARPLGAAGAQRHHRSGRGGGKSWMDDLNDGAGDAEDEYGET